MYLFLSTPARTHAPAGLETSSDRVRVEFAKFAVSTNNTAEKEAAKKRTAAAEARKQAKADKKKK